MNVFKNSDDVHDAGDVTKNNRNENNNSDDNEINVNEADNEIVSSMITVIIPERQDLKTKNIKGNDDDYGISDNDDNRKINVKINTF